jgi:hypothetical protein
MALNNCADREVPRRCANLLVGQRGVVQPVTYLSWQQPKSHCLIMHYEASPLDPADDLGGPGARRSGWRLLAVDGRPGASRGTPSGLHPQLGSSVAGPSRCGPEPPTRAWRLSGRSRRMGVA